MKKKIVGIVVCLLLAFPLFSFPTAADPDAELDLRIVGGLPLPFFLHYVGGAITNIGNNTAYNITMTMTIRGGIFDTTNDTVVAFSDELLPQQAYGVGINGAYGFGLVTITLSASASNAANVTATAKGIQIGGFTWVPLSWIRIFTGG